MAERRWRWLLALLLAWSFGLRLWYASVRLEPTRFWDERYGLANVASVLTSGSFWPANAYHPTLSWLPQALLLAAVDGIRRLTGWPALTLLRGEHFTPLAYLLCRGLQVVFGTLSILVLVRLAGRWFGPAVGLAAGFLLAVSPWHLRQSAIFKPDILLLLLAVVAVERMARTVLDDRLRPRVSAGVWLGLALATKYNAAPLAAPLLVGELLARRRGMAGALVAIGVAAAAALAVFLLLDPHLLLAPEMVRRDFGRTLRDYSNKAQLQESSRAGLLLHAVASLLSTPFHGPIVGVAALAGLAWLAWRACHRRDPLRVVAAMVVSFVVAYVAAYLATTRNASPHNWLPLLPFTSLAAAALLAAAWRLATARVPALGKPAIRWPGGVVLVAMAAWPAVAQTLEVVTPSTWQVADRLLARELGAQRRGLIVQDRLDAYRVARWGELSDRATLVPPATLRRASPPLDPCGADAEVYLAAGALRASCGRGKTVAVEADVWRRHGPALSLRVHPWRELGEGRELQRAAGPTFTLPTAPGELVSFEVYVLRRESAGGLALRWGDREAPLVWVRSRARRAQLVSPRLPWRGGGPPLRVVGDPPPRVHRIVVRHWTPDARVRAGEQGAE